MGRGEGVEGVVSLEFHRGGMHDHRSVGLVILLYCVLLCSRGVVRCVEACVRAWGGRGGCGSFRQFINGVHFTYYSVKRTPLWWFVDCSSLRGGFTRPD